MLSLRSLRFLSTFLALGTVLLLTACSITPQPLDLIVLHTNDVLGFTEPAT